MSTKTGHCSKHGKVGLNKEPKNGCPECASIYFRFSLTQRLPIKPSRRHSSAKDYKRHSKHKKPLY